MKTILKSHLKNVKKIGLEVLKKLPYVILALIVDLGKKLLEDRVVGGTNRILDQHGGMFMSLSVGFFQYLISKPLAITALVGLLVLVVSVFKDLRASKQTSGESKSEPQPETDQPKRSIFFSLKQSSIIGCVAFLILCVIYLGFALYGQKNNGVQRTADRQPSQAVPTTTPEPEVTGLEIPVKPRPRYTPPIADHG